MSLTNFGAAVREARRNTKQTLMTMAIALKTSPAFLSAMETGRNKIPADWVEKIANYFTELGYDINIVELKNLAASSNNNVSLDGLSTQHKMLVAGFANSDLNQKQLEKFSMLLQEIYSGDNDGK